ncbi:MAG: alpha-amylase family glycosyl hydrolase [Dehalococcoidia bacterium]
MTGLRVPAATYRVQLNQGFRFSDARALVPYLHKLGITDLYVSPIVRARPGSTHGYDVTDPTRLNPELGSEDDFESLVQELKRRGMGLLLDIVPNHMAASADNPWWADVLENGQSSPYASYFDIDWHRGAEEGAPVNQVFLPILGAPYETVLENQELTLTLDQNGFAVRCYDSRLPLDPKSYSIVLAHCLRNLKKNLAVGHPAVQELVSLINSVRKLPPHTVTASSKVEERRGRAEAIKRELWRLYSTRVEIRDSLDETMRLFNGRKGEPASFALLDELLAAQPYRLAFWRMAAEGVNYRRFFDINGIIAVRIEDAEVFAARHLSATGRLLWCPQLASPSAVEDRLARRARLLSRNGALGFQPGGPG